MKSWRTILAGLALLGASVGLVQAELTPAQTIQAARQAFDQSDYPRAAALYQVLVDEGLGSAALYYNLANAEFKAGQVGRAVAFYRRALQRAPWDPDIRYNLNFARSLVQKPEDSSGPLARLAANFFSRFPGHYLAAASLVVYWSLMILATVIFLRRGGAGVRWAAVALGLLFMLMAVWTLGKLWAEDHRRMAVVVVDKAEARNGPGPAYRVGFTIPEGREIRILGQDGGWLAVGLIPEGFKGWVKRSDILEDE